MEAPRTAGGIGRAIARRCRVALVLLALVGAFLLDGYGNHLARSRSPLPAAEASR